MHGILGDGNELPGLVLDTHNLVAEMGDQVVFPIILGMGEFQPATLEPGWCCAPPALAGAHVYADLWTVVSFLF